MAITLGCFRIEPDLGRVIGPSSESRLMPGAMNILVYLLENAPRVVSADELLEAFWPGRIVDASTIHRRISQIRRALDDDPRSPALIATVPKRGYRIIGEIHKGYSAQSTGNGESNEFANIEQLPTSDNGRANGSNPAQQVPFIGRQTTLELLEARLQATGARKSSVVFLSGPPGIGKTRCAREFLDSAQRRGIEVFSSWCDEQVASVPLWPWSAMVSVIADADRLDTLRPDLDHHLAALCELVPELSTRYPDLPDLPKLEAEAGQVRLRVSVAALIHRLSSSQPLLMFFDDLHNADSASLSMLEFVTRSSANDPVLVLCTARNTELDRQHPLTESIARLTRHCDFERVTLEGLSTQELNQLIGCFSSETDRFAATVAEKTDGNPLYATLLMKALASGTSDTLSTGLREVIVGSFAQLSDRCWQSVCVAAVIGHEFSSKLISAVADIDEIALERALLEARRAGVLAEDGRFSHILIQEAVLEEIPAVERRELHSAIATHLSAQPTGLLEVAAITHIARHFALSSQPLHAAKWYSRASSRMQGTHDRQAYESSLLGLRTVEEHFASEPTPALAKALVSTTIGALHVAGIAMAPAEEAANLYQRARQIIRGLDDRESRLCLLMTVYSDYLVLSDRAEEALQRASEAYEIGQKCDDEGIRLHASITLIGRNENLNRYTEAYEIAMRELSNPPEDPLASFGNGSWPAYPRILVSAAQREAAQGYPREALTRVQEALNLLRNDSKQIAPEDLNIETDKASYRGSTQTLLECINAAASCYGYLGEVELLEKCATHSQEWVRNHEPHFRPKSHRLIAQHFWLSNRWQELEALADQAPNDFAMHSADPYVMALRALALSHLGDHAESEKLIQVLLNSDLDHDPHTLIHCGRAMIRSGGTQALSNPVKLTDDIETLLNRFTAEGDRPHLLELQAQIALVRGDELGCQRKQNAARELWLRIGAPAQIARMVNDLATLSRGSGAETSSQTSA